MIAKHPRFPQAPRNRTVNLVGRLAFPNMASLSPLVIQAKALERAITEAPPSTIASLSSLSDALKSDEGLYERGFPGLIDDLAPYFSDQAVDVRSWTFAKVRTEFSVYSRIMDRSGAISELDSSAFISLLLEVHRRLGTGANCFRTGPVVIKPDAAGNKITFPHHGHSMPLMIALHDFLVRHMKDAPGLCATAAYAAIIHAHPFNDGNGRTARTIYNLVLGTALRATHFLPIHMIGSLNKGSFLIKLRRALYAADWCGLQAFFCDAVRLSIVLQSREFHDSSYCAQDPCAAATDQMSNRVSQPNHQRRK